jgi:hypothetical protein
MGIDAIILMKFVLRWLLLKVLSAGSLFILNLLYLGRLVSGPSYRHGTNHGSTILCGIG